MNKKAYKLILPETLKIVLAVISIGLLIYLAVSLGGIFTQKSELDQAKANLGEIKEVIEGLEEGQEQSFLLSLQRIGF